MKPVFKKHLYIKVYQFTDKKTVEITYHKIATYQPTFLIHPDHIFNSNGFQTVIITNKSAETINPLDFQSKYNACDFETAMTSKLVKDAFGGLAVPKIDIMKLILFANLGVTLVLLYILLKNTGAV
jgi:hypothetical protein